MIPYHTPESKLRGIFTSAAPIHDAAVLSGLDEAVRAGFPALLKRVEATVEDRGTGEFKVSLDRDRHAVVTGRGADMPEKVKSTEHRGDIVEELVKDFFPDQYTSMTGSSRTHYGFSVTPTAGSALEGMLQGAAAQRGNVRG